MHVDLGGYHISDIEFTAAFDVVKGKVGEDLAEAIWAHPNDTIKFADVPKTGITVSRGMTHDGIGKYLSEVVEKAPGETADIVKILRETGTDVVVNYLPVGSEAAAKWYAEQILEAGVAMVNCMPVFIARERYWQKRFEAAGVPIIGDDIKSQVGATISHRVLTSLFRERGVHLDRTMQLNVGGNSDFRNMLERERLESKKISKTNAVTSMLDYDLGEGNVHVGPSDYVPWLTDRKWAYIRMEGTSFGDVPLNLELKLEVWDSPNSAGIVIDAVRLAKLALNNGDRGRARGAVELPDEVAARADRGRRGAREHRAVHHAECPQGGEGEGRGKGLASVESRPDVSGRRRRRQSASGMCPCARQSRAQGSLRRALRAGGMHARRQARYARGAPHLPGDPARVVSAARHNEHVAGVAAALRARGHDVVVLAPSSRSADLVAGRRALQQGTLEDVVALARAVPVSPRSAVGIPVGVRANVATALRRGDFDVVHGFDPAMPGLSYVALLEAETTTAATFVDPERLGFPRETEPAATSSSPGSTRCSPPPTTSRRARLNDSQARYRRAGRRRPRALPAGSETEPRRGRDIRGRAADRPCRTARASGTT